VLWLFEAVGVARTERSIVNWCQPNRTGIARLNSYFDPNDRKYYVTRESVERAIQEEIQRARKTNEPSEAFGTVPNRSEKQKPASESTRTDERLIRDMEREIADLKIANRVKDSFIEHLQNQADGILGQLVESSRKNGELETRLLQLEGPKNRLHQEEAWTLIWKSFDQYWSEIFTESVSQRRKKLFLQGHRCQ
jgi:hypothetical protein